MAALYFAIRALSFFCSAVLTHEGLFNVLPELRLRNEARLNLRRGEVGVVGSPLLWLKTLNFLVGEDISLSPQLANGDIMLSLREECGKPTLNPSNSSELHIALIPGKQE